MQKYAESRGGRCLSSHLESRTAPLSWECSRGHAWRATWYTVKSWCPQCRKENRPGVTITEMRQLAEIRKGHCLSEVYLGARTALRWRCEARHEFERAPTDVKEGRWCPHCRQQRAAERADALDRWGKGLPRSPGRKTTSLGPEVYRLAAEFGGLCLSKRFGLANAPLKWECVEGHRWKAPLSSVQDGNWCPKCEGVAPIRSRRVVVLKSVEAFDPESSVTSEEPAKKKAA